MQFIPVYLIMIPIITALIIYLCKHRHMNYVAFGSQAIMTVLAVFYFVHYRALDFQGAVFTFGGWDARVGISLANDALSMSFVFLALFSWWMVLLYVFERGHTNHNFLFFLIYLQGVFLGFIQTIDLFNMFVFFELTTIIVTILIAIKKTGHTLRAALYYLLLNTSGVLAFLIGIIFIYNVFGTINIRIVADNMHLHGDRTVIRFAYILMMAGISVKAALFPVFTWLPKAHGAAQAAISALLSGLIVKGGLYLFIRMNQMFAPAGYNYANFFFVIGIITALLGIIFAITQTDIKQMLAYSTISQVGLIMIGLSSMRLATLSGGVYHIFNHALFKILLFLGAGIIIKVYQTKKITEMRGVFKSLPIVSISMIFGMLAITGAPFFNGYISKSVILYGFERSDMRYWMIFLINIGTATLFVKMASIFFGPKTLSYPMSRKTQSLALVLLAFACLALGVFYLPISSHVFGLDLPSLSLISLSAFIDYTVTISIAFAIYWFLVAKDKKMVVRIRNFSLSFETANILFIGYIVLMSFYFVLFRLL